MHAQQTYTTHRTQRTTEHLVHTEHKRNTWASTPHVGIGRIQWYSQKYVFYQAQVHLKVLQDLSEQIYVDLTQNLKDHTQTLFPQILDHNPANPHKPMDDIPLPQNSQIDREEIWGWNKLKTKTTTKVLITEDKWFSGGSRSGSREVGRVGGVRQTPHDSDLFQQQHALPTSAAGTWSICAHNLFQSNKLWLMVTKVVVWVMQQSQKFYSSLSLFFLPLNMPLMISVNYCCCPLGATSCCYINTQEQLPT